MAEAVVGGSSGDSSGGCARVVITQASLHELQPPADARAAWIPYVSWLPGAALNSSQLSVLSARAAEVWVPSAFLRAVLLRMLGTLGNAAAQPQVRVPQLCPACIAWALGACPFAGFSGLAV